MSTILVTGAIGFIGYHLTKKLLKAGYDVIGVDNVNSYYDPKLKEDRLEDIVKSTGDAGRFHFYRVDITDGESLHQLFAEYSPSHVVNLAAQAGVRYSIEAPQEYIDTNVTGFQNILDACKTHGVEHLLYASSSSVYGNDKNIPFSSASPVDHPVSMYAATKRMNELMAHVYSHMYGLKTSGLRFFTVYGPWGRPDMAPMKFAMALKEGRPIDVYNHGEHWRDFTYVDDIVSGITGLLDKPPIPGKATSPDTAHAPFRVYNIGAQTPVHLLSFIECMEKHMGVEAKKNMLPMQQGDVERTFADVQPLYEVTGYSPSVPLDAGIETFVRWFKDYYK